MGQNLEDLKKEIEIKKSILKNECNGRNCPNKELIDRTQCELDCLLYKYYKTYKCGLCLKNYQKEQVVDQKSGG